MGIVAFVDQATNALLDFGLAVGSTLFSGASSVGLTVCGSEDPDGNEEVEGCEVWGDAALTSRPQDPDGNGGCEVMFARLGDERVVIGTKDRRHQRALEKGEALLRALGFDGSRQAVVLLKPDGDMSLEGVTVVVVGDNVKLGSADASESVALASKVQAQLDAIATTLASASSPSGAVTYGTPYNPAGASVGSTKVKADE